MDTHLRRRRGAALDDERARVEMVTVARTRRRAPLAPLLVLLVSAFLTLTVLAALASALDEWA